MFTTARADFGRGEPSGNLSRERALSHGALDTKPQRNLHTSIAACSQTVSVWAKMFHDQHPDKRLTYGSAWRGTLIGNSSHEPMDSLAHGWHG